MDREIPIEERNRNRRKVIIRWTAIALIVAVGLLFVVNLLRDSVNGEDLNFSIANRGHIESAIIGSGKVVPLNEQIIVSPISSKILETFVVAGDTVSQGSPLILLDLRETENELNRMADERRMKDHERDQTILANSTKLSSLNMQLRVKEMEVSRLAVEADNEKRLDSLGSGTGERVKQAELALTTGRLELDQLRRQIENEKRIGRSGIEMKDLEIQIFNRNYNRKQTTLEEARILSPRKATVTYINSNIGQQVSQGEKLAVISDLSHFKISGEISESLASQTGSGAEARVVVASKLYNGRIASIEPSSNHGSVAFTVVLDDSSASALRAGMRADIYIVTDIRENVVRIANGPYFKSPGIYEMFVRTSENELERRTVTLGASSREFVEVESGLQPGEEVVVSDMTEYKNMKKLKIK